MDPAEHVERILDDVVVEHFRAFYNCENDGLKKYEYAAIHIAFVQFAASAQSSEAALIVTDAQKNDILFDGIIEKDWEFFLFPATLQPGAPPECQVATRNKSLVKYDSEDPELLQWFSFLTEADQLRFRDLFQAALERVRLSHEAARAKLVTAVVEKGLHRPARRGRSEAAGAEDAASE